MPLIIAGNERSALEQNYDDVIGVRYEYPARIYRKAVQAGTPFIYYRGSRRASANRSTPEYLGTGIIGEVRPSKEDRLVCDIDDWRPFTEPVPFRDHSGEYYETGAVGNNQYWRRAVRSIDYSTYERILTDANTQVASSESAGAARRAPVKSRVTISNYASSDRIRAIDEFAIAEAKKIIDIAWAPAEVEIQPHNNPGYDIRVGPPNKAVRYIEVKGTTFKYPRFFLSEGERLYSVNESERYTLLVIHSIDLEAQSFEVFQHDGAIESEDFKMTTRQWHCEVPGPNADVATGIMDGQATGRPI
ncbi:DUF3883 domain-containing protein [Cryptosporangium japonicum]|uniref:Protein NO VEIN C-terminal domain-containing protein n=1 Tax=Cryptosporangium japonicum TaxID=80872 RepID=A0ABP3E8C7_9ACTN